MFKNLKGKNILITAGPTWVPIDKVRIISNIATGKTGIQLAKQAKKLGAKVTLLLGPVAAINNLKGIRVLNFKYFQQLYQILKKELKSKRYDALIHSAAVSDFKPKRIYLGKLKSDLANLRIDLESTIKIVDRIKSFDKNLFLVAFKLELAMAENLLINRACLIFKRSGADLVVANRFDHKSYRALIIDKNKNILARINSKDKLPQRLLKIIEDRL